MCQLELFRHETDVLTEISVAALTTDEELRDIGRALIALVRYHDEKLREKSDDEPKRSVQDIDSQTTSCARNETSTAGGERTNGDVHYQFTE